jgi:ribulose-bisphosphate carboxylase large chain
VPQGPLIGTIIKPSVGLSARGDRAQVRQLLADGGIDFIKDDELQADGPALPLRRARARGDARGARGRRAPRAARRWWPST